MRGVLLLGSAILASAVRFTTRSWTRWASGISAATWRAMRNFTNASVAPIVSFVALAGVSPVAVIFITGEGKPPTCVGTAVAAIGSFPPSRSSLSSSPWPFSAATTASLVASAV